ncbi:ARPP-1 family domain-containing protein [Thermostichus sp. OS-CIW-20]
MVLFSRAAFRFSRCFLQRIQREAAYRLPDHGAQEATISEINQNGVVPYLVVENYSGFLLLLVEGQELVGAKQNRILNTAVLNKPKSKITILASCVEAFRRHFRSHQMEDANALFPAACATS